LTILGFGDIGILLEKACDIKSQNNEIKKSAIAEATFYSRHGPGI